MRGPHIGVGVGVRGGAESTNSPAFPGTGLEHYAYVRLDAAAEALVSARQRLLLAPAAPDAL